MRFAFLLILMALNLGGFSQSYEGNHFWLGILPNQFSPRSVQLMVNSEEAGFITASAPAQGFSTNYAYNKGTTIITLNKSLLEPSAFSGSIDDKGMEFKSTSLVRLKVLNDLNFSSDVSPLIPYDRILSGDNYIIQSLEGSLPGASSFTIVSPQDNTELEINVSAPTVSGNAKGSTFSVTLNEGETLTVRAKDNEDLSGTTIKAKNNCDKFLVFTGSRCSQSNYNSSTCTGCDHLFSQLIPISHFGTKFHIVPFFNQSANYTVKVTAYKDATDIIIDGIKVTTINAKESYEYRPFAPWFKKTCLETSKPTLVYQYMNSSGCNGSSTSKGDPSMLLIPSVNKWTKKTSFGIFNSANVNTHFVNIVSSKNAKLNINSDVSYIVTIDSTLMCEDIAVFTISTIPGTFHISSDSTFYSYVYSTGTNESYMYLTGALVFPFDKPILTSLKREVCFNDQPIEIEMLNDSLVVNSWYMGDGSQYGSVNPVTHSYSNSGKYLAKALLQRTNNSSCIADSIDIEITVFPEITPLFLKDSIVCPGEKMRIVLPRKQEIEYTWNDGSVGNDKEFTATGTYSVTQTDTNGCKYSDSFVLNDSGCFDKDITIYNTFTPNADNYNDLWVIDHKGYKELTITIFNRYGTEVFKGNILENEFWNGKLNNEGTNCAEGTYYYQLIGIANRATNNEVVTGVLTLIR